MEPSRQGRSGSMRRDPELSYQVSPKDSAQLRDLGLLVDEQPAADVEA
jgi:hypothetical protein